MSLGAEHGCRTGQFRERGIGTGIESPSAAAGTCLAKNNEVADSPNGLVLVFSYSRHSHLLWAGGAVGREPSAAGHRLVCRRGYSGNLRPGVGASPKHFFTTDDARAL